MWEHNYFQLKHWLQYKLDPTFDPDYEKASAKISPGSWNLLSVLWTRTAHQKVHNKLYLRANMFQHGPQAFSTRKRKKKQGL